MGGISFSFRKGPIFLEEDGARVASVHSISRAQKFTAVVWDLTACISLVGIGALTWAYCILEPFSNDHWYLMEYYTWPYFLMVIILVGVSLP
jgi:hypothetical protein